jgi:cytochrome P450
VDVALELSCAYLTLRQWGLIELARRPDLQEALRKELRAKFSTTDPTWDQLMSDLPLLDAVVHETLRLHAAVPETLREASLYREEHKNHD